MSLYENNPISRQSAPASADQLSPAYKRLLKDLSFDNFIQISRQESFPTFQTPSKSFEYHRRRYSNLSNSEKIALHDELVLECLNSPHRLEPIGLTNAAVPFYMGMLYLRELACTLELKRLPISDSLRTDVLDRLACCITSPVSELKEFNDLSLLPLLLPEGEDNSSRLDSLIDQRINWELENNFERILYLISIDIFQDRLPTYSSDETNQNHVKKCIIKFLESYPATWVETGARKENSLAEDQEEMFDPLGLVNLPPSQLIAGVISSFKVSEILDEQEYLDRVEKVIVSELEGSLLFGVNGWLATLERCRDGVSKISQRSRSLLDNRQFEVHDMLVDLLQDREFADSDLTIVRETCRNFKLPESNRVDTFCQAVKKAVVTLSEQNCSIYKIGSLLKILPFENISELLSDTKFHRKIKIIFNKDRKDFNRRMEDLKEGEGVVPFEFRVLPSIKKVVQLYRERKALLLIAEVLSCDKNKISTCPSWVTVLGKAHPIVNDRIEKPLESGKCRSPEEISVLGASWELSLDFARASYLNNSLDSAWSTTKQLVTEAKRLDCLHSRIEHIHEALELLAILQPNGREKDHKFRAAVIFGMRNLGLLSLKVGDTLAKFADYLGETGRPNQTILLLVRLIANYHNPQFKKDNKQKIENLITDIYQNDSSLSVELGFKQFWFLKILKNCY